MTLPGPHEVDAAIARSVSTQQTQEAQRLVNALSGFLSDPVPQRLSERELDIAKEGIFGSEPLALHVYCGDSTVAYLVASHLKEAGYEVSVREPHGPSMLCVGSDDLYCVHVGGLTYAFLMKLPWVVEFVRELSAGDNSVAVYRGTYAGPRPRIEAPYATTRRRRRWRR